MERKLIGQGGGGYTIYLPKKWIEENKLKKGQELNLEISGNDLVISPKPSQIKSSTEIKLNSSVESLIRTLITNSYRAGYDKIKIFFDNDKQFIILQKIIKTNLIGFEIIKKENDYCIVENITEPSFDQFDNLLKKMFMNIEELFDITEKRFTNSAKEIEDYTEVEERILKYDNFCRRVISRQKLIKKRSELFWTFLALIIHAQRELYHLNTTLDKKINVSKQTLEIFEKTKEIFQIIQEVYYNKEIEKLSKTHELQKTIMQKYYSLIQKSSKENIILFHLTNCARQFYLANSPLSGLIL